LKREPSISTKQVINESEDNTPNISANPIEEPTIKDPTPKTLNSEGVKRVESYEA
jgi:hypothetical protein